MSESIVPICRGIKKFILPFNERELCFSEDYPKEMTTILSIAEIDGVIHRINDEFRVKVALAAQRMRVWCITSIMLALVAIGFFGIGPSLYKIVCFRREMHRFWRNVRQFLLEINRQIYQCRRVEWRLVEDRSKLDSREIIFPLLAYVIEVTVKPTIPKLINLPIQKMESQIDAQPERFSHNSSGIDQVDDVERHISLMVNQISSAIQNNEENIKVSNSKEVPKIVSGKESLDTESAPYAQDSIIKIPISRRKEIESVTRIENLANFIGEANPLSGNGHTNINASETDSSFTDLTTTSDECRRMI
jgi:hypothetical protein